MFHYDKKTLSAYHCNTFYILLTQGTGWFLASPISNLTVEVYVNCPPFPHQLKLLGTIDRFIVRQYGLKARGIEFESWLA
jgi:hypothetical protein